MIKGGFELHGLTFKNCYMIRVSGRNNKNSTVKLVGHMERMTEYII